MSDFDPAGALDGPFAPDGAAAPPPTAADVRTAADRLKSAIDLHLSAVESRTGENDPDVQAAFDALQAASESYDDLLFEVYDEVTPFENVTGDELPEDDLDPEENPPVVSLFVRRDYALAEPQALLEAGRSAHAAIVEAGFATEDEEEPTHLGSALYTLFNAAGVDGLDDSAPTAGLEPLGGTVWFVAGDEATPETRTDPDTSPFAGVDEKRLIYRVDEVVGS